MAWYCSRCNFSNPDNNDKCYQCNTPRGNTALSNAPQYKTKVPVGESALGCFLGAGYGIWMILIGIVLCCTGIGAIIGIPLIIAGIVMPIAGGGAGLTFADKKLLGQCPYCKMQIEAGLKLQKDGGLNCPSCAQRVLIRDGKFIKLEDV
ncbi:hypothetical protein LLG39_09610 [bacterium]|nr:hypothetical protein [bacterium]